MVDLKKIEEDAVAALHDIVGKAAAAEPTVEEVVAGALEGAGVPPVLVEAARGVVNGLLGHWLAEHAPAPAVAEPAADLFPAEDEPPAAEATEPAAAQNYV